MGEVLVFSNTINALYYIILYYIDHIAAYSDEKWSLKTFSDCKLEFFLYFFFILVCLTLLYYIILHYNPGFEMFLGVKVQF